MRDFGVDDFLVAVQREVVALRQEIGPGHAEALRGARVLALGPIALRPAGKDVGQVVLRVVGGGERGPGHWAELFRWEKLSAFVVERHAVGVHVVEPDVVRAAGVGLCEEKDGGGDAGVGLEHATGQRDDSVEFLFLDKHLAQGLVRVGRAEEHAVGHDDGGASAGLEQAQKEGEEEQFGLLGLDDLLEVLGAVLVVERAGEGRIGEDEGVFFLLARVVLRKGVAVADVGVFHAVQEHVHTADAEHGVIEVEAVEEVVVKVFLELRVAEDFRVMVAEVFARRHEEAARTAGGIADDILRRGRGEFDHELDDVARSAKLAVLPGAGDFAEHVFVEIALGVAVFHRDQIDHVHHLRQQSRCRHGKPSILHVMGVSGAIAAQGP